MTNEQVIKALDCCVNWNCKECPFFVDKGNCTRIFDRELLNLINRQKEEIERLSRRDEAYTCKVKVGNNCLVYAKSLDDYDDFIGDVSAEAIKEFAERLKYRIFTVFGTRHYEVELTTDGFDRIVKEMTEGRNGE